MAWAPPTRIPTAKEIGEGLRELGAAITKALDAFVTAGMKAAVWLDEHDDEIDKFMAAAH